jgi:hypothetical protein
MHDSVADEAHAIALRRAQPHAKHRRTHSSDGGDAPDVLLADDVHTDDDAHGSAGVVARTASRSASGGGSSVKGRRGVAGANRKTRRAAVGLHVVRVGGAHLCVTNGGPNTLQVGHDELYVYRELCLCAIVLRLKPYAVVGCSSTTR